MGTETTHSETVQQGNLFTGEWVTVGRKKTRFHQLDMFSLQETFVFGQRVRPYLANAPRSPLELISEDPRTEDEMENDRFKQAEALTANMFTEMAIPDHSKSQPVSEPLQPVEAITDKDEDEETEVVPSPEPLPTKYAVYVELVRLAEERAMTISIAPVFAIAETISMSTAKFQALQVGLTGGEIAAALLIGDFRGKQRREAQSTQPSFSEMHKLMPQRPMDIPVLWLNRADLVKRRPDLAPIITKLRDDEIEDLSALVGQALQEFYWIQLNVVLSLYLDHDLKLRRAPQS